MARETPRSYWEAVHRRHDPAPGGPDQHWLDVLLPAAGIVLDGRVLEIGCGLGHDTRYLLHVGCRVTALDLSAVGLDKIKAALPGAGYLRCVLPAPLPFADRTFDGAVAGLSLHYYRRAETAAIVGEIHRVMRPGAALVFRVNAWGDFGYGFGQGREVEAGVFDLGGRIKRFFSQEDCLALLAGGWDLVALQPLEDRRFGPVKQTWAAAARKTT